MIYLDNNATTRVAPEVLRAMEPYYLEYYGNAHAIHALGRRAHEGVEDSRAAIAKFIDADPSEVIFTSCGTEGNAIVIRGLVESRKDRRKIVTTAVEHPSVMLLLKALDIELAIIPVGDDGAVDLDAAAKLIDDRTLLVTAMLAQNETGVIHPVERLAAMARSHGALMHVDAVQAAGKIPFSARDFDFLTISGHKFHAPKGIGALTIRRGLKLPPIWYGGGQELGMRSGTEAVPAIVGMGVAATMAREALPKMDRVRELRDRFESQLTDATISGATQPRLPNTSNVVFAGRKGDDVLREMDAAGICVSAGAACHSGKGTRPAARFSLSRYTTEDEIRAAVAACSEMCHRRS